MKPAEMNDVDRKAAKKLYDWMLANSPLVTAEQGRAFGHKLIEAFAEHRQAAEADGVERCGWCADFPDSERCDCPAATPKAPATDAGEEKRLRESAQAWRGAIERDDALQPEPLEVLGPRATPPAPNDDLRAAVEAVIALDTRDPNDLRQSDITRGFASGVRRCATILRAALKENRRG